MQAEYKGRIVYITYISKEKSYVIASYSKDRKKLFKINTKELNNISEALKFELEKKGF